MYGLLITLGIFIYLIRTEKIIENNNLSKKIYWDISFWALLSGLVGARIYYVISNLGYFSKNPLSILFFWKGGMGILGAVLLGTITVTLLLKRYEQKILLWLDILALTLPLSQAVGRWGNYFNRELMPYAIYESFFNIILFIFLAVLNKVLETLEEKNKFKKHGIVFITYIILYLTIRILLKRGH